MPEQQDRLIRATAANGRIRVVAVSTTQTSQEASRRHQLSPAATAALSRAMGAALLMASSMKPRQSRVSLRITGDGSLGTVCADAGQDGTVRGFVGYPDAPVPLNDQGELAVAEAVGRNGFLQVMRDVGYGEPFSSTVELVAGNVSADVAWYLAASEQTYSRLLLGEIFTSQGGMAVLQHSAGVLFQVLPGRRPMEEVIRELQAQVTEESHLPDAMAQAQDLEGLIGRLLGPLEWQPLPLGRDVRFQCRCSFERVLGALKMLGESELQDMLLKDEGAEATCHFCAEIYRANSQQLLALIDELRQERV
ncbi:MAG: Hsp33 family molecular chaperone HslO [Oscillatoriales cyanobacterium SM2_2_1]|nr:Hsp33 family molecular chaperone HslO [Oscillatoriales cyanobacterium SM2_2_1]